MANDWRGPLDPVRPGLVLGLVAVLYGWGLGILFGAGEDWVRKGFVADAEASRALYVAKAGSEAGATAAMEKMDETAWRYFLRAHLHAGSIGGIALVSSLLLSALNIPTRLKLTTSTLLGLGAVGYPLFWMLAGLKAPGLGSTAAAKDSLRWLAIPASGALVAGALITLAALVFELFLSRGRREEARRAIAP
jgi:hypothetical protein